MKIRILKCLNNVLLESVKTRLRAGFALLVISVLFAVNAQAVMVDRVLVIVNEDIITQSDFDSRLATVKADMSKNGNQEGLPADFSEQLLKGMVSDSVQLQEARRRGISISDEELRSALERFGAQQKVTYEQLIASIEQQGQSFKRFSESVRESLTISRLTEYYAATQVVVPDYEIDGFIAQNKLDDAGAQYNVAHIFIENSDAGLGSVEKLESELKSGLSFEEAVVKYSQASDAKDGGVMGWRRLSQLPTVFADAIKTVSVGGITDAIKTDNGFHILKLIDMKGQRQEILQTKVQHILISSDTEIAKSQAAKRLQDIRSRIQSGEDFSSLARIYSDDSVSAANGGGLGWVSPGDMVPAFEQAFQDMPIGVVSEPISTRFGVHILKVLDRRKKNITEQTVRSKADNILRRQRADREFQQWVRELKEQAYIKYVSEPTV